MYEDAGTTGVTEAAASLWLGRRISLLDARGAEVCAGFLSHVSARRAFVLQDRRGGAPVGTMRSVELGNVGAIVPTGDAGYR